jgi:hypothetical protein
MACGSLGGGIYTEGRWLWTGLEPIREREVAGELPNYPKEENTRYSQHGESLKTRLSIFYLSNTFSVYFRITKEQHVRLEFLSAVTEKYCTPGRDVVHCNGNVWTFGINLLPPGEGKILSEPSANFYHTA